jgi:hypothetical protein
VRRHAETERVLATVLFTDIVDATEKAARLGDRRWRELLESHHQVGRRGLARFRGREIDTAGDGFFAAFDGPARAVRCACAVASAVKPLGIEVRAGAHTGECEVMGDKFGGIAVHIGARVAACAGPSEVLVSSTSDSWPGRARSADRGRTAEGAARRWGFIPSRIDAEQCTHWHQFDDGRLRVYGRRTDSPANASSTRRAAAGRRWVDVGCGNGAFTELLLERAAAAHVEGIDPSEAQVAYARTRLADRPVLFRVGDATALPYADGAFDAAAMALVIFFVPEPAKGVAEMARVVRPGGSVSAYAWDMPAAASPTRR